MLTKMELEVLSAHALHGTHARYNAHLLKNEEPCDRCRDGEARYRAELRAKRRVDHDGAGLPRRSAILRSRSVSASRTRAPLIEDEELEHDGLEAEEVEAEDFDNEEIEDDEERFELDDEPRQRTPEWSGSLFGPAFGKIGVGTPSGASSPARRRSPQITMPSTNGVRTDPRTRLRAITAELDARKPRGPAAVKLLVEAASYLTGDVTVLAQYGDARKCAPEDIAAAERVVVGKGRG